MLADRIAHYEKTGEFLKNTPAQYKKEFPWLKEVDSLALANVQLNLNKTYKSFFQSVVGFHPLNSAHIVELAQRKSSSLFESGLVRVAVRIMTVISMLVSISSKKDYV